MSVRTKVAGLASALVAIVAACQPALAQDSYPSHPVRIIMSLPPGSAPDIRVRIIANQLTTIWGRQVVVENRAGAGGALAVQAALAAPADGYTLLSTVSSVFTILPAQRDKLPFDINRDLVPIALTGAEGMVLAVSSKLGVNNLAEFIALAKAQPHKLIIGTNPAGSLPHLAGRLFAALTKRRSRSFRTRAAAPMKRSGRFSADASMA
jgi:tripartite-type tricarboxylate transporter receptor subunit TctC